MVFQAKFYKGTRPGLPGVYNRLVRGWERGPYSHCELLFSDGRSWSASFMDHGVRWKFIDYDDANWDTVILPKHMEKAALLWFLAHEGESYDLMGNLHLVIGFLPESRGKKFCSEALMASLDMDQAWRMGPNAAYETLCWRFRQEQVSTGL
jgi:hypothetical protein